MHPTRYRNILLALGWYYPEIHRGVAKFARDHRWHVTADFDDPVPKRWNGDGIITLLGAREELYEQLHRFDVPIIDLAESRPEWKLPRVTMDNAAIGRLAAEYFLNKGFRNLAVVQRWNLNVSRTRREHFMLTAKQAGASVEVLNWQLEQENRSSTYSDRHQWLRDRLSQLSTPLAVFAARDYEAVEVIEACVHLNRRVPEEIAVLGVDNSEVICESLCVSLSSIDPGLEKIGFEGASMLESLLTGVKPSFDPKYIAPLGIAERHSTSILAVEHPLVAEALHFIHANAHRALDMHDLIRHVGLSRSGLEKAFREHYVRPPIAEFRRVKLDYVKAKLVETDHSIGSIAIDCGFSSTHHLDRLGCDRLFGLLCCQWQE
jgi:LacI family transcriptional regulator